MTTYTEEFKLTLVKLAGQIHEWRERPLAGRYPVILIDAIHKKVRRGHVSSEAFYVVMGLTEQMQREVLAITNLPSESPSGWSELLESLKTEALRRLIWSLPMDCRALTR